VTRADARATSAVLATPGVLHFENRPLPERGAGEVLVSVHTVSVCGSDVGYWRHGGVGTFRGSRPFVLGHEGSGTVVAIGDGVTNLSVGARVAIDPGTPCGVCAACLRGRANLCSAMRYMGSGALDPPTDGLLSSEVVVRAAQCHLIPDAMTLEEAALVEPTAVALHAVRRSEVRAGMRAAVLGGGPIGLLVIQVLKSLGAASVDLVEPDQGRRERALDLGADSVHAPADLSLAGRMRERELDLVIEASGVPESLAFALDITDPGGVIVQVGSLPASEISLRATSVLARELDLRGSFRFLNEFPDALDLIASGSVRAATLVDATFDFKDAAAALEFAAQGTAIKTQIAVSRGSQGSADWAAAARDQTAGVSN
jgi:threonine dehydrogenase-like Zn-dependent dehydrogenase